MVKDREEWETLMGMFTRVLLKRRNYFASKVEIYNTCIMFLKGIMKGLATVLLLILIGFFDLCVYVKHTHKIYL